jgi:YfiH family protein
MTPPLPHIDPDWPAPAAVTAFCTTRAGGVSRPPFDSCNLGLHVGDDTRAVTANRARVAALLPADSRLCWLQQVHGTDVVEAGVDEGAGGRAAAAPAEADALWSRAPGMACAIMTADCLPVLLCSRGGDVVGAAHAGWRGLAAGVLEALVAAMDTDPAHLLAWMGPAIGPRAFEVGAEVRDAFLRAAGSAEPATAACFRPSGGGSGAFYADLYALARLRLSAAGVGAVYGGGLCTYGDPARFFSHRRDGETGRMAAVIAIREPVG